MEIEIINLQGVLTLIQTARKSRTHKPKSKSGVNHHLFLKLITLTGKKQLPQTQKGPD
jgi:hypothetical protein